MTTECIEVEYPFDGRRKATIVTSDKALCEHLANHPFTKFKIKINLDCGECNVCLAAYAKEQEKREGKCNLDD